MLKFTMSSRRVVVDPKSLTIRELREIYDADTDDLKREATNVLTYIHVVSQIDPDAPYYQSRADEVELLAKYDIWGKDSPRDTTQYNDAVDAYKLAFEPPEVRLEQMFNRKLDQLHDMLSGVKPEIEKSINMKTGSFTYVTNTKAIMQVMKDLDVVMDAKEQLEERIRNDRKSEVKIRGGRKESFLEKKRILEAGRKERSRNSGTDEDTAGEAADSPDTGAEGETHDKAGAKEVPRRQRQGGPKVEAALHGDGPADF